MTYRVSRSGSNYELQSEDNPYLHYIHNAPQSASVEQQNQTYSSIQYHSDKSELLDPIHPCKSLPVS